MLLVNYTNVSLASINDFTSKSVRLKRNLMLRSFNFLTLSELDRYFSLINLKVPSFFSSSGNLIRKRVPHTTLTLSKYFMTSGQLNKVLSSFSRCMLSLSKFNEIPKLTALERLKARGLDRMSNNKLRYGRINPVKKTPESIFFKNVNSLKPLFHFYVYKVDKQIYKNSRGKSGKYTFLWKYVTPYKRFNFVASKLSKEIKFDSALNLQLKINSAVTKYVHNKDATFTAKSIRFSNNYVFFNSRNSLLQNYRTVKSR